MLFLLSTPEYNNIQSNTTKIRVYLRTGVAEIFEQHQDLMGKVENNIIEIETNFENKVEKFLFILQDAVFIVSNQGLETNSEEEKQGTSVYVYAKKVLEVNSSVSIDAITQQYDEKKLALEEALSNEESAAASKTLMLKADTEFLEKSLGIIKSLKK